MDFTLFDDFITLQALLKDLGIIASGGAIKPFLASTTVLLNGEEENRRGKKLRVGDQLDLPEQQLTIRLVSPSAEEVAEHQAEQAEKQRVLALVKQLNKTNKAAKGSGGKQSKPQPRKSKAPVRFPGT